MLGASQASHGLATPVEESLPTSRSESERERSSEADKDARAEKLPSAVVSERLDKDTDDDNDATSQLRKLATETVTEPGGGQEADEVCTRARERVSEVRAGRTPALDSHPKEMAAVKRPCWDAVGFPMSSRKTGSPKKPFMTEPS